MLDTLSRSIYLVLLRPHLQSDNQVLIEHLLCNSTDWPISSRTIEPISCHGDACGIASHDQTPKAEEAIFLVKYVHVWNDPVLLGTIVGEDNDSNYFNVIIGFI